MITVFMRKYDFECIESSKLLNSNPAFLDNDNSDARNETVIFGRIIRPKTECFGMIVSTKKWGRWFLRALSWIFQKNIFQNHFSSAIFQLWTFQGHKQNQWHHPTKLFLRLKNVRMSPSKKKTCLLLRRNMSFNIDVIENWKCFLSSFGFLEIQSQHANG